MGMQPATQSSRRRNGAVASAGLNADDHVDSEIRRLYEDEGWTGPEIARQVGCATTTVYARLARLGMGRRKATPRGRGRPKDDELRRLYEDHGLSLRQIARHFSVTPQAVRSWMVAAEIPRRPPGAVAVSAASERIVALYRQGLAAPQIAARLGCSSATVYRRLSAAGVERRTGPAVDRQMLLDALTAGLSGPEMAERFGVSVTAIARALRREGLETSTQAARRRATEHYAALLDRAERTSPADVATVDWLRQRVGRRPSP